MNQNTIGGNIMKDEYDLSKMKSRKNPYAKRLKKQITIRLAIETIDYFKNLAAETGMPYQNLIDLYLNDCAQKHKKLEINWE
jgi:predicted DNA binding CopG/RHH family protein